jgi:hypothetical protein
MNIFELDRLQVSLLTNPTEGDRGVELLSVTIPETANLSRNLSLIRLKTIRFAFQD